MSNFTKHKVKICFLRPTLPEVVRKMNEECTGEITGEPLAVTSFEWKVPNFFKLLVPVYCCVKSPKFSFLDAEWQLKFCTNLSEEHFDGWTTLHLIQVRSVTPKHHVVYHLGMRYADGTEYVSQRSEHRFEKHGDMSGTLKFVERSALLSKGSQLASQGTVTFFCTLHSKAIEGKEVASQTMHAEGAKKLVQDFKDLLINGEASDVTLKVKNREFRVHSAVLVARSSVFAAMMKHDMKERRSGIIEIQDCEPDAFQQFLSYIYSGDIQNFSMDTVCALYDIGDKYDTGELKTSCIQFMMENLSVEMLCDVLSLSLRHGEHELLEKTIAYFAKNLKKVLATIKWITFVKENPLEANEMYIKAVDHLVKPE